MKREYKFFLKDIVQACKHIQEFTHEMNFEEFIKDEKTSSAVIRKIEIIGEAVKNIPFPIREKYPDIPWKDMAGIRDRLIHAYFSVNYKLVWGTVEKDIPHLFMSISKILNDSEQKIQKGGNQEIP